MKHIRVTCLLLALVTCAVHGLNAQDASAEVGSDQGAASTTEPEGWSFESLKEEALEISRGILCPPAADSDSPLDTRLPACAKGCLYEVVGGVKRTPGFCKGLPGSRKVFNCVSASDSSDGSSPSAFDKLMADVKEKLSEFITWTGICDDVEESLQFETEHGNFPVDYESAYFETYEEFYGEETPGDEDTSEDTGEDPGKDPGEVVEETAAEL